MDNKLFRQKSIDKISSPEQLHDYMRVTSPRLWMILAAILLLLGGFIVYASTTTITNTLPVKIDLITIDETLSDGQRLYFTSASCRLSAEDQGRISVGMNVEVAGEKGKVSSVYTYEDETGVTITMDKEVLNLPNGTYDGEIILESRSPISFLLN